MRNMVRRGVANTKRNNETLGTLSNAEDEVKLVLWEQHASPRGATESE